MNFESSRMVSRVDQSGQTGRRNVTKPKCDGMAAGRLTSRAMFKLWAACRRRGPVSRVRQIRNGCDACTARPPCSRPHNIPLSLPLSHARARKRLSPSPTAFISHQPLRANTLHTTVKLGSFLSAQGSVPRVHVDTYNKRAPFCTFEETGAVPKFTGR